MSEWYKISNIDEIDSPALAVYPDRIQENIDLAIQIAGGTEKLRPHVKTNKMKEVCTMMLKSGISKYKCATISEAEMLAMADTPDVLLAYQPVGPKIERLVHLIKAYPGTTFSCLIDNETNAIVVSDLCKKNKIQLNVYIDLNIGMNRTGIQPDKAVELAKTISGLPSIRLSGLHGYDGHIHDENTEVRKKNSNISFGLTKKVFDEITPLFPYPLVMIMGGTPTFPMHIHRPDCECSPGTFIFWDWGYKHMLEDLPFHYAAVVISRVISIIDKNHICIDLGHKSVAAENPLPRVHFLNAPGAKPVAQSEEHLVLEVSNNDIYETGTVLYGIPVHICPTVALYDKAFVIKDHEKVNEWNIIARNRYINF